MRLLDFNKTIQHPSDRALAQRIQRGEEKAIVEFMDIYFPRLYRFAMARLGQSESDAEDAVQQTLTIAARRISTYRGEAAMMTWLAQICRREVYRLQKRNQVQEKVISLFDDEPLMSALFDTLDTQGTEDPLVFSEKRELVTMVHTVLDQLPNRHGDVLEWKYIEGLSINEIADRLNIGAEAVQSQLARARHSFKSAFEAFHNLYYQEV